MLSWRHWSSAVDLWCVGHSARSNTLHRILAPKPTILPGSTTSPVNRHQPHFVNPLNQDSFIVCTILVPPLRRCSVIRQQLHQPVHLRRKIRGVPEGRQTHGALYQTRVTPGSADITAHINTTAMIIWNYTIPPYHSYNGSLVVMLSVRPSVRHIGAWWQNEWTHCRYFNTLQKINVANILIVTTSFCWISQYWQHLVIMSFQYTVSRKKRPVAFLL